MLAADAPPLFHTVITTATEMRSHSDDALHHVPGGNLEIGACEAAIGDGTWPTLCRGDARRRFRAFPGSPRSGRDVHGSPRCWPRSSPAGRRTRRVREPAHRALPRLDTARTHQTLDAITAWIAEKTVDTVPVDHRLDTAPSDSSTIRRFDVHGVSSGVDTAATAAASGRGSSPRAITLRAAPSVAAAMTGVPGDLQLVDPPGQPAQVDAGPGQEVGPADECLPVVDGGANTRAGVTRNRRPRAPAGPAGGPPRRPHAPAGAPTKPGRRPPRGTRSGHHRGPAPPARWVDPGSECRSCPAATQLRVGDRRHQGVLGLIGYRSVGSVTGSAPRWARRRRAGGCTSRRWRVRWSRASPPGGSGSRRR